MAAISAIACGAYVATSTTSTTTTARFDQQVRTLCHAAGRPTGTAVAAESANATPATMPADFEAKPWGISVGAAPDHDGEHVTRLDGYDAGDYPTATGCARRGRGCIVSEPAGAAARADIQFLHVRRDVECVWLRLVWIVFCHSLRRWPIILRDLLHVCLLRDPTGCRSDLQWSLFKSGSTVNCLIGNFRCDGLPSRPRGLVHQVNGTSAQHGSASTRFETPPCAMTRTA
jgi:hypothetical protein